MPITTINPILRTLLVAIDGSENSGHAIAFALGLARRHDGELIFCTAVDRILAIAECSSAYGGADASLVEQTLEESATAILAEAATRAASAGLRATTALLDGRAAPAIVTFAKDRNVDAIVMGTQGKHGLERMFLGSTADDVLRRSDVAVFVVPPAARVAQTRLERILVAVDDSDPGDGAATFAGMLAQSEAAQLVVCGVAETVDLFQKAAVYGYDPGPMRDELLSATAAYLAVQVERYRANGIPCERLVVDGEPAQAILDAARAQHADLIVVGTHGRRGVRRLFFGSVAESIVRASSVPVVVIRSDAAVTRARADAKRAVTTAG